MDLGELYRRLVVMRGSPPKNYQEYYQLVKETIEEMTADFKKTNDFTECVRRWIGSA